MAKQRGRPKSAQTLESEGIEAMLKNPPSHIPKMTNQQREAVEKRSAESKAIEDALIADYPAFTPHNLIFEMASLGDESMYGYEDNVIARYGKLIAAKKIGQLNGAQIIAKKSRSRAKNVWGKNLELVNQIGRNHTIHSAAQKILSEWDTRGDGGDKPSVRTVQYWYRKFIFK